jgi:hypothetical protein
VNPSFLSITRFAILLMGFFPSPAGTVSQKFFPKKGNLEFGNTAPHLTPSGRHGNSKFEYRNSKQSRRDVTNDQNKNDRNGKNCGFDFFRFTYSSALNYDSISFSVNAVFRVAADGVSSRNRSCIIRAKLSCQGGGVMPNVLLIKEQSRTDHEGLPAGVG